MSTKGLHPMLRLAVRRGLMTEAQARDVDAMCDGLATAVTEGALTVEQAGKRAEKQAIVDANARNRQVAKAEAAATAAATSGERQQERKAGER